MISITIGGEEHRILVEFTDHCFTEEALPNDDRPKFAPCSRKDGRFCEERWKASLDIWEHIHLAVRGWVWLGEHDRCLVVKLEATDDTPSLHYVIPFTLERSKGDRRAKLKMLVRSAFLWDDPSERPATFGVVKFNTLVVLALKGAKPRRNYDRNRKTPW